MINTSTPSSRFLNALNIRPAVRFQGQAVGEEIVLLLRAHPITQLVWVINSVVLFLLLGLMDRVVSIILNPNQLFFLNIFSIAFILSYIWSNFLVWFYNVGIVTNQRIVDIDFTSVLFQDVAAAKLEKLDEVRGTTSGFFGSIFNYGDVFVLTLSDDNDIEFLKVPAPNDVVLIINGLVKPD